MINECKAEFLSNVIATSAYPTYQTIVVYSVIFYIIDPLDFIHGFGIIILAFRGRLAQMVRVLA